MPDKNKGRFCGFTPVNSAAFLAVRMAVIGAAGIRDCALLAMIAFDVAA